jgi:hypothetical protein
MSEKKKKERTGRQERSMFLVDYDLPKNSQCRRDFYEKMKDPKFKVAKSTRSVVICDDLQKAVKIHRKAAGCGKSNIYRVKKLRKRKKP